MNNFDMMGMGGQQMGMQGGGMNPHAQQNMIFGWRKDYPNHNRTQFITTLYVTFHLSNILEATRIVLFYFIFFTPQD